MTDDHELDGRGALLHCCLVCPSSSSLFASPGWARHAASQRHREAREIAGRMEGVVMVGTREQLLSTTCSTCGEEFSSRWRLHGHILATHLADHTASEAPTSSTPPKKSQWRNGDVTNRSRSHQKQSRSSGEKPSWCSTRSRRSSRNGGSRAGRSRSRSKAGRSRCRSRVGSSKSPSRTGRSRSRIKTGNFKPDENSNNAEGIKVDGKSKDSMETTINETSATSVTILEVADVRAKGLLMGTGGRTVKALHLSSGSDIDINHGTRTVAIHGSEVAQVLALRLIHAKLRLNGFSYTVLTSTE